jgi:hypothetical protein
MGPGIFQNQVAVLKEKESMFQTTLKKLFEDNKKNKVM